MTGPARHVLVVASQCDREEEIEGLTEIAASLSDLLSDPDIGCCAAGLPDGTALISGTHDARYIEERLREAVTYAARNGATLVLAMLGHGFIPGTDPTLYFMGRNSSNGDLINAVNVTEFLQRAADTAGMAGLIAIIDTCHAAAAMPGMNGVASGTRGGQTRFSLVLAAGVHEPAYELKLSRALTQLLASGLPSAGPWLSPWSDEFITALRAALPDQPPVRLAYDATTDETLWLARNRTPGSPATGLGVLGTAELGAALAALYPGQPIPADWDAVALAGLSHDLAALPASPARVRAQRLASGLLDSLRTASFLRSLMADHLTSQRLRRALAALGQDPGWLAGLPGAADGGAATVLTESDAVEHTVLTDPASDRNRRSRLAQFVVELADDAGIALDSTQLRTWARSLQADVPFNDAVLRRRQRPADRRLRLVVGLHYRRTGDWPEDLGVWLVYDGAICEHFDVHCPAPDQDGAELALAEAVDRAVGYADALGVELARIEVAAPVKILLSWRPEETPYGQHLGLSFEVLARCSRRLEDSPFQFRVSRLVWRRLVELRANGGGRLDWLTAQHVADESWLKEALRNDRLSAAIGLIEHPGENEALLELLLDFSPVLVWPRADPLSPAHQETIGTHLQALHLTLIAAYRARWRQGDGGPMANVCAITDDEEWLAFCQSLRMGSGSPLQQRSA